MASTASCLNSRRRRHHSPCPRSKKIVDSDASTLFVASDEGLTVGMLTLVMFSIPTGLRAYIEDVVVDQGSRGKRNRRGIDRRRGERGARAWCTFQLTSTSRPSREAANALYQKLGFERRDSQCLSSVDKKG